MCAPSDTTYMRLHGACWPLTGTKLSSGESTVSSGLCGGCRWACLHSYNHPEEDTAVHKMVMNVGQNPTMNPADAETTVEVHVMHKFSKDFYGEQMSALACGFIRCVYLSVCAAAVCHLSRNTVTGSMRWCMPHLIISKRALSDWAVQGLIIFFYSSVH